MQCGAERERWGCAGPRRAEREIGLCWAPGPRRAEREIGLCWAPGPRRAEREMGLETFSTVFHPKI